LSIRRAPSTTLCIAPNPEIWTTFCPKFREIREVRAGAACILPGRAPKNPTSPYRKLEETCFKAEKCMPPGEAAPSKHNRSRKTLEE
jgi:hypothetical protein